MQALLQRAMPQNPPSQADGLWSKMQSGPPPLAPPTGGQPPAPQPAPPVNSEKQPDKPYFPAPPPNKPSHLPSADKRWATGESMKQAYANDWQPNPALIRALSTR